MPVCAELAAARRKRGLSVEELSAKTKIQIYRLRALEGMEWEQLPTLVYLKGFLHAYAAEVQLDPDKITERYLQELNEIAPEYAEREAHPPPVPEEKFVVPESIWDRDPDYDDLYAMDVMRNAPLNTPEVQPALHVVTAAPRKRTGRYVAVGLVGIAGLVAGALIGLNLQQIISRFPTITAAAPRVQESAQLSTEERIARAREIAAAAAAATETPPPLAASFLEAVPVPLPEAAVPTIDPTVVHASSVVTERAASSFDLSGWWTLTSRLDSEAVGTATRLNLGFHLQLQQRGNRVSGTGEKWMENGRSLPASSRAEIDVDGTLIGRRLELNFTERGTQSSAGKFVMDVTDIDTLRGRFVSTATNAHGMSVARRLEPTSR